jgi:hypothetical protein
MSSDVSMKFSKKGLEKESPISYYKCKPFYRNYYDNKLSLYDNSILKSCVFEK